MSTVKKPSSMLIDQQLQMAGKAGRTKKASISAATISQHLKPIDDDDNNQQRSVQNIYETVKDLTVISTVNQSIVLNADQPENMKFNLKREQIVCDKVLLEGTFGRIFRGKLKIKSDDEDDNGEKTVEVLIKTVNDCASIAQIELMISEGCSFKNLKHKHLISLLGVCIEPDRHPLLVFPFCEYGNLKLYLKNNQKSEVKADVSGWLFFHWPMGPKLIRKQHLLLTI